MEGKGALTVSTKSGIDSSFVEITFADTGRGMSADELEREKEVQIAGIRSRKDDLLKSASLAMRRTLFGEAGYGLDSLGSEESAAKVSVAGLKAFQQKLTVPNNCVLAVFGDIKAGELKAAVEKALAGWKRGPQSEVRSQRENTEQRRVRCGEELDN